MVVKMFPPTKDWSICKSMTALLLLETYPMVPPKPHTTGIHAKPSALFVESVSSPIALFMTPVGGIINRKCEYTYDHPTNIAVQESSQTSAVCVVYT